jgi:hypothetical protein
MSVVVHSTICFFLIGKDLLPPACLSVYCSTRTKTIMDYASHGGIPVNAYVELVFKID